MTIAVHFNTAKDLLFPVPSGLSPKRTIAKYLNASRVHGPLLVLAIVVDGVPNDPQIGRGRLEALRPS
jgi:hypothetical protein